MGERHDSYHTTSPTVSRMVPIAARLGGYNILHDNPEMYTPPTMPVKRRERSGTQENAQDKVQEKIQELAQDTTKRARADPMAFSSILSSNTVDPPRSTAKIASPIKLQPPVSEEIAPPSVALSVATTPRKVTNKVVTVNDEPETKEQVKEMVKPKMPKAGLFTKKASVPLTSEKESSAKVQKALAELDAMEHSDLDSLEWSGARGQHAAVGRKRLLLVQEVEAARRKVCSLTMLRVYLLKFPASSDRIEHPSWPGT